MRHIYDRLITNQEIAGSIPGYFYNLKSGLGLKWSSPNLVKTIEQLLYREVADLIKKVDIITRTLDIA